MPLPFPRDSDWVYNLTLNPLPPNRVEANPSGDQLRGSRPQSGKTTVMNETKQPFLFQILILESSPDVPAFRLHWACHCPSEGSQDTRNTSLGLTERKCFSSVGSVVRLLQAPHQSIVAGVALDLVPSTAVKTIKTGSVLNKSPSPLHICLCPCEEAMEAQIKPA